MKNFFYAVLVIMSSLIMLSACQTAPVQPERIMTLDEFFAPPADKVLSRADNIVVKGVRSRFIDGYLAADFKLKNNRGLRSVINYRGQWLDRHGMLASPYDAWLTTAFEGQQEAVVTVISPDRNAADYRLELQPN